jgi:hypothetical protein
LKYFAFFFKVDYNPVDELMKSHVDKHHRILVVYSENYGGNTILILKLRVYELWLL